ncbi:hypothetical protein HY570_02845 [Candidatus Micrarchaeota archaeon]|nr:hypothetical protein [Candidatus Micrarchaeota archaeon]
MRIISIFLIAFLLLNVTAFWTEILEVHVVDKKGRPLPNSEVEITYQREKSNALDGKIATTTDASGIYTVKLVNSAPAQFEKNDIIIKTSFGGVSNTTTLQHLDSFSDTARVITTTLPIFELRVKLLDYYNKTIPNGAVRVGPNLAYTNSQGVAILRLPTGTYEIVGKYGDTQERKISTQVADDVNVDISLPVYNVMLKVINQYGNPVKALITGKSISTYTDDKGELVFNQFQYSQITLLVAANSYPTKNLTVTTGSSQQYTVILDSGAPSISNIRVVGNYTAQRKIIVEILDNGNHSSGLQAAYIEYSTDNGASWNKTNLYPISYKDYEATLPAQKTNTTVIYKIIASDKESNIAETEVMSFTVREKAPEPSIIPGVNLDIILWPVVIVIVLVILFLAYKKYQGEL